MAAQSVPISKLILADCSVGRSGVASSIGEREHFILAKFAVGLCPLVHQAVQLPEDVHYSADTSNREVPGRCLGPRESCQPNNGHLLVIGQPDGSFTALPLRAPGRFMTQSSSLGNPAVVKLGTSISTSGLVSRIPPHLSGSAVGSGGPSSNLT